MIDEPRCPLCQRSPIPEFSDHHLIPKSRGGGPEHKKPLCLDCHNSIHRWFTNRELEKTYFTVEALLSHEGFAKHITWLSKQDPNRRYRTKTAKRKRP